MKRDFNLRNIYKKSKNQSKRKRKQCSKKLNQVSQINIKKGSSKQNQNNFNQKDLGLDKTKRSFSIEKYNNNYLQIHNQISRKQYQQLQLHYNQLYHKTKSLINNQQTIQRTYNLTNQLTNQIDNCSIENRRSENITQTTSYYKQRTNLLSTKYIHSQIQYNKWLVILFINYFQKTKNTESAQKDKQFLLVSQKNVSAKSQVLHNTQQSYSNIQINIYSLFSNHY
ncbi:hypothetical protein TTHERM_000794589 (macronuclear) [Tetrahymena thermophila SB210]|uniref:Uncharacterized protein n=1 Tax=Tetrahymena thermophila (strain SB210) TaxID=312017 RepID=W7X742_TETTS|nr:hypothetical protein TTHERM_000794589 [Tetrahymena thermophila SB210]EWS73177.1 hypothetical protein TTHERM_000794589 [Tetrahymena thermophila SB210]|eukprot:XP_012654297.1 hypothetical protein TTHERM_000794589 [Tetrahymena thermophila SB210]